MTNEDHKKELRDQVRTKQEKFIYYIIATTVASIAFSVYQTTGKSISYTQIPLAIAVLSWSASIWCGFRWLAFDIATIQSNAAFFEVMDGINPITGDSLSPAEIESGTKQLKKITHENSSAGSVFWKWNSRLFYFGMISFIAWHFFEMYSLACF